MYIYTIKTSFVSPEMTKTRANITISPDSHTRKSLTWQPSQVLAKDWQRRMPAEPAATGWPQLWCSAPHLATQEPCGCSCAPGPGFPGSRLETKIRLYSPIKICSTV